ncbi:MAG: glycosyltransferase family 2 protein [Acidobacteriota bacterium]
MSTTITVILVVIFLGVSLDSYLRLVLLALRWILPRRSAVPGSEITGAIILIAARDEEGSIGPTVTSLQPQVSEWPGSRLWVVADNCGDETAREARAAGALVAERTDGKLGKGAVIDWWLINFPEHWAGKSSIVVLDADSRLISGSLGHLRQAMSGGADAAQAFVAPEAGRTPGRLAGYSEVLMQRIDDEARRRAQWPVPLRGTGMVIRAPLLAELAPRLHTLAEDLELDVLLSARHASVVFVPDAVVRDPKPRESAGISRQRARWLQGQLQVVRDYWGELLSALASARPGTWMLLPLLLLRPKVLFIVIRVFVLVGAVILGGPWWIVAVALLADAAYYVSGAAVVDEPSRYLLDLASAPGYLLLWCRSLVVALFRRGGWLRAGR